MENTQNNSAVTTIENIQNLLPEERPEYLNTLYEKNRAFFRRVYPKIDKFLDDCKCPYQIDITQRFLNIINGETGQIAHPEVGLDSFAMMLGDWLNDAWVDLFNFRVVSPGVYKLHSAPTIQLATYLAKNFPTYLQNHALRRVNLKELKDGRRFSPPVIFLGVFHGLHIDYFLSRTEVTRILLMEPDHRRFEVSCYFLDYEKLYERFGSAMYIAIGDDENAPPMREFFNLSTITPFVWTRVLAAYEYEKNPVIIENFKLKQTIKTDMVYPLDWELLGLKNGIEQLIKKRPLLSKEIHVSNQCRVAVVATGPSLNNDLDWLKKNQDKLIIFAVHSSVKVLRKHGIIPDFQFSLDMHPNKEVLAMLDLCKDKPLIQYYKGGDEYFDIADKVLMVADGQKTNPVIFKTTLTHTNPSTTCMAFSFAVFCKPREIFLLGCDFGYRALEKDHAEGSLYDTIHEKRDTKIKTHYGQNFQALINPNFPDSDLIQTTTLLSNSKNVIESRIQQSATKSRVYNLSDGAQIQHAHPRKSSSIKLKKYAKKNDDISQILRAFIPAEKDKNWFLYSQSGEELFVMTKEAVNQHLPLKSFSWYEAAKTLDTVVERLMQIYTEKNDYRMEGYVKVISDLLSGIYCCLIFHDAEEDGASVYEKSINELAIILDRDLSWPSELDDIG